jgi:hypothetical protein
MAKIAGQIVLLSGKLLGFLGKFFDMYAEITGLFPNKKRRPGRDTACRARIRKRRNFFRPSPAGRV